MTKYLQLDVGSVTGRFSEMPPTTVNDTRTFSPPAGKSPPKAAVPAKPMQNCQSFVL
jgi:hypothetical protein